MWEARGYREMNGVILCQNTELTKKGETHIGVLNNVWARYHCPWSISRRHARPGGLSATPTTQVTS